MPRVRLCDQPGCQKEAVFNCEWAHCGCHVEVADLCGPHALARTAGAEYSSIDALYILSREDVENDLVLGHA